MSESKAANHDAFTRATVSGSPVKKSLQGGLPHNPAKRKYKDMRRELERELRGLWVGPMPVQEFMDEFLPLSDSKPMPALPTDCFQSLPSTGDKTMPTKLAAIVESVGLFPGLKLVDTSDHHDINAEDHKKLRPDMSAYLNTVTTSDNVTQFEAEELMFELKPPLAPAHPFKDPKPDTTAEQLLEHAFETNTDVGILCRGQIASYLNEWFSRQHRLHGFLVYVANDGMRFIRADRSGAIVSRLFNWRQEPQIFSQFLWRFAHLTPGQRGRDPTVRSATPDEERLARLHLRSWEPTKERPIVVLQVPDQPEDEDGPQEEGGPEAELNGPEDDNGGFREVIAWGAMADADSLTGRATRAWPVYDLKLRKVVFLKDSWRSLMPGMEKESKILSELDKAGVRNVPKLICGNDIDDHLTCTHNFTLEAWNAGGTAIIPRAQHRFLEDFIGTHLRHSTSSKQFMQAIYDAFIAHQDAYEKCGILHRDVSGNNVMMKHDGGGILNDWDQARRVADMANGPRQLFRSGTWYFMSILLLEKPGKLQDLQDDIESFVYVVLYHVIRYMNHNGADQVPTIMEGIFDDYKIDPHGNCRGGAGKRLLLNDWTYLGLDFASWGNSPLRRWLIYALGATEEWLSYATRRNVLQDRDLLQSMFEDDDDELELESSQPDVKPALSTEHLRFHNHHSLAAMWRAVLNKKNWPQDDKAVDHMKNSSSRKRTHDDDPFDSRPPFKKCRTIATPYVTSAPTDASVPKIVGGATLPAPLISTQSLSGLHEKITCKPSQAPRRS